MQAKNGWSDHATDPQPTQSASGLLLWINKCQDLCLKSGFYFVYALATHGSRYSFPSKLLVDATTREVFTRKCIADICLFTVSIPGATRSAQRKRLPSRFPSQQLVPRWHLRPLLKCIVNLWPKIHRHSHMPILLHGQREIRLRPGFLRQISVFPVLC